MILSIPCVYRPLFTGLTVPKVDYRKSHIGCLLNFQNFQNYLWNICYRGFTLEDLQREEVKAEFARQIEGSCPLPNVTACNPNEKYRRADGSCNNLNEPRWGMAGVAQRRVLEPVYGNKRFIIKINSHETFTPRFASVKRESAKINLNQFWFSKAINLR